MCRIGLNVQVDPKYYNFGMKEVKSSYLNWVGNWLTVREVVSSIPSGAIFFADVRILSYVEIPSVDKELTAYHLNVTDT